MSVTYSVKERYLHVQFKGATPARDVYTLFHRAYNDPTRATDGGVLIDLTESTSLVSRTPELLRMLSQFVIEHPDRPGRLVALVLTEDNRRLFAPFFAELQQSEAVLLRVFTEMAAATTWLEARDADAASES